MRNRGITRRDLLAKGAMAAAALPAVGAAALAQEAKPKLKGRINHSVCKWCYGGISLDQLCQACKRLGIKAVDLLRPGDFATVKKHGLVCSMTSTHGIGRGLNRKENHAGCLRSIREAIEATSAAGFPNVICFSGNRAKGLTDEQGLKNCAEALKQVVGLAEKKNVTINMELLNSKVNHRGYMCDYSTWAFELARRVGSPRLKVLFDIYHVQIMEGDIIRTIRKNIQYIGHFHTGGNPGRHEINETQELYYPAIMRAIADSGFKGYVAQEFTPTRKDKLKSLEEAVRICDV